MICKTFVFQLSYDWKAKRFEYEYSVEKLDGSKLTDDPQSQAYTEIVVPEILYPDKSYQVDISPTVFEWRLSETSTNIIEIVPGNNTSLLKETETVKIVIAHANAII